MSQASGHPSETLDEKGMAESFSATEGEKREAKDDFKTPPAAQLPKTSQVKLCGAVDVLITPLMFSPTSSVASLDSFDHDGSLQDGYSSYEEASHATSGCVSPFDLPDSPSQTITGGSCVPLRPGKNQSAPPLTHQNSMYADAVRSFQDEGTPMAFSTCISLSGLALEEEKLRLGLALEEEKVGSAEPSNSTMSEDSETLLGHLIASAMPQSRSHLPKPPHGWPPLPVNRKTMVKPKANAKVNFNASDDSSCSQEQQDLLAECIASAMPLPATRLRRGREAVDGAPASEPKQLGCWQPLSSELKQGKRAMSHQRLPPIVPSTPPERRGSHLESEPYDERKGDEKVQMGGSELSSASSRLASFLSHLPRPCTVGRSSSSGSSPGAPPQAAANRAIHYAF